MRIRRHDGITSRSIRTRRIERTKGLRPILDCLEVRQLLTTPGDIVPGQIYQDVAFVDSNWDTVEVKVNGPTTVSTGFTLRLAGDATDYADIDTLNLVGLTSADSVSVTVTPNELTINGGTIYNKMYSSGYTNIRTITASDNTTGLGGLSLSAVIVGDIALPNVAIAGSITLDTGMTAFVDRVDSSAIASLSSSSPVVTITSPITGEQEIIDESPVGQGSQYNPVTGLIDLYNVEAQSIGSIVINGAISGTTNDPYDETQVTNDLRGIVTVSGDIGSIVAPRSAMRNAIRAGGIGSIQLGQINGEITTTDAAQPLTIALPKTFTGFLNVAGHLNLGFNASTADLDTGDITAGGGSRGSAPRQPIRSWFRTST
ncbi:MAG: hypothetical protein P4L84_05835 [Isosphaeraceae bacterium]|nr:hypothetical protein [Isosphaeraceae bacterium]